MDLPAVSADRRGGPNDPMGDAMPKFLREFKPEQQPAAAEASPVTKCPSCNTDYYGDPPDEGDECPECGYVFEQTTE